MGSTLWLSTVFFQIKLFAQQQLKHATLCDALTPTPFRSALAAHIRRCVWHRRWLQTAPQSTTHANQLNRLASTSSSCCTQEPTFTSPAMLHATYLICMHDDDAKHACVYMRLHKFIQKAHTSEPLFSSHIDFSFSRSVSPSSSLSLSAAPLAFAFGASYARKPTSQTN